MPRMITAMTAPMGIAIHMSDLAVKYVVERIGLRYISTNITTVEVTMGVEAGIHLSVIFHRTFKNAKMSLRLLASGSTSPNSH